jgi:hypothetical protein
MVPPEAYTNQTPIFSSGQEKLLGTDQQRQADDGEQKSSSMASSNMSRDNNESNSSLHQRNNGISVQHQQCNSLPPSHDSIKMIALSAQSNSMLQSSSWHGPSRNNAAGERFLDDQLSPMEDYCPEALLNSLSNLNRSVNGIQSAPAL